MWLTGICAVTLRRGVSFRLQRAGATRVLHSQSNSSLSSDQFTPNESFSQPSPEKQAVRVRFAPSPTGHLHLGGLRTALFNFLFARRHGGTFILRIEDTDQTRAVRGATEQLVDTLRWSGIHIDEGVGGTGGEHGPYVQSERLHIYNQHIETLLQSGAAYHCFCSERRLELLRRDMARRRETVGYDNRCRHLSDADVQERLSQGVKPCVRLKLTHMRDSWRDLVFGDVSQDVAAVEGDPILLKSDGFPTYHFANVVDDHLMEISHVLRGMEWQISTTKHLLLYRAFGWTPPQFAHLPLLLNPEGRKLSKREDAVHVEQLRKKGNFPEAVLNLLCPPGSLSFQGVDTTGLNINQLAERFELESVGTTSVKLSLDRLGVLNRAHLQRRVADETQRPQLVRDLRAILQEKHKASDIPDSAVEKLLKWGCEEQRVTLLTDFVSRDFAFLWNEASEEELREFAIKRCGKLSAPEMVAEVRQLCARTPEGSFTKKTLHEILSQFARSHKINMKMFFMVMRVVISPQKKGPPVVEMVELLGKQTTDARLERAHSIMTSQLDAFKSPAPDR